MNWKKKKCKTCHYRINEHCYRFPPPTRTKGYGNESVYPKVLYLIGSEEHTKSACAEYKHFNTK